MDMDLEAAAKRFAAMLALRPVSSWPEWIVFLLRELATEARGLQSLRALDSKSAMKEIAHAIYEDWRR